MTSVRASMRREERDTAVEDYTPVFDTLSIWWGLVFVDDQIAVPIDLRKRLIDILHYRNSGTTKMLSEAKFSAVDAERRRAKSKRLHCLPYHTVERAIQTIKILLKANMETVAA